MFASDIHGSLLAMEHVLRRFAQNGVRWLVILGDVLNYGSHNALPEGYTSAEVAAQFSSVTEHIITVRSNYDNEVGQMLPRFPMTVPWQQVLDERCHLFLIHDHLYSPENLPSLDAGDALVYGHTHVPVAEKRGTIHLFNLGLTSIPKGGYSISYGLLGQGRLQISTLDDNQVIAEVVICP